MKKHLTFINMAETLSLESKCVSMKVACLAVNERGRIVATGVNGTASGYTNCNQKFNSRCSEHSDWSQLFEIHAEMNCILEMARSTTSFSVLDFYITNSPCDNCLKHMIGLRAQNVEVRNIIFGERYYRTSIEELTEQKTFCSLFGVNLLSIDEALGNKDELQS